jgi:hypothetical protein
VAKARALATWKKKRPILSVVLDALEWQKVEWAKGDLKFIPHPASWIHDGRWEDERPKPGANAPVRDVAIGWAPAPRRSENFVEGVGGYASVKGANE